MVLGFPNYQVTPIHFRHNGMTKASLIPKAELVARVRRYYAELEARVRRAIAERDELVTFAYQLGEWDYRCGVKREPDSDISPQSVVNRLMLELGGNPPQRKGITALRGRLAEHFGISEIGIRRRLERAFDEGILPYPQLVSVSYRRGTRKAPVGGRNGGRTPGKPKDRNGSS